MKPEEFWANFYGNLCIALTSSGLLALAVVGITGEIKNLMLTALVAVAIAGLAIVSAYMAHKQLKTKPTPTQPTPKRKR